MQRLGRPERHHDVGLDGPAIDTNSLRQRPPKVRALGVVAAGHVLEVGEAGAVLDVQQRRALDVPRDQVGAAGKLEVLVWLVDADSEAVPAQAGCLELRHRRVHRVD